MYCFNTDSMQVLVLCSNVWTGEEQDSFKAVVAPFKQQNGITINLDTTRDLNTVLTWRQGMMKDHFRWGYRKGLMKARMTRSRPKGVRRTLTITGRVLR